MQDDYKQSDQITPWLIYSSQPSVAAKQALSWQEVDKNLTDTRRR